MSFNHRLLWAKSSRDPRTLGYHPLICHLIDTGNVARVLWRDVLPHAVRALLADDMEIDEEAAAGLVPFLAAVHDIGKATPVFQSRSLPGLKRLQDAGILFPPKASDPGHGRLGVILLEDMLLNRFGWPGRAATQAAMAIGAHHGTFIRPGEIGNLSSRTYLGQPAWKEIRDSIVEDLLHHMAVDPELCRPVQVPHASGMVLAGLISVADWIASDEHFFPFAVASDNPDPIDLTLDDYSEVSATRAKEALQALGWLDWSPDSTALTFADLFPSIAETPRPAQRKIIDLPEITDHPGMVILELPMGEGKTEAAFYLADRWSAVQGQRGSYIAMPTMATANQMFSRARDFLSHRFPEHTLNVQLLHSHAALETGDDASSDGPAPVEPSQLFADGDTDDSSHRSRAGEWFTKRKRGLLAPFGVGTVDQSLLAALQTPHAFVRLFGLAGKTVIFDEVHAYDTYMSTLFERLLQWLGAVGSSVVVLSATLPDVRTRALLTAYQRGRSGASPASIEPADYPRISWLTQEGIAASEHVETSAVTSRRLQIELLADDVDSIGMSLQKRLADGGCVAIICNTVRRAQETYQALKSHFPGNASDGQPVLDLFHARYPFEDRMEREERALIRFGKPNGTVECGDGRTIPVSRPDRAILVATQVIEQSLDLDFDLMITDLAPIDLILQRSGRLHRHDRGSNRPTSFSGLPTIQVIQPKMVDGLPAFPRADQFIYDHHVLLRTWISLQSRNVIQVPGDVAHLIESVYDDRSAPPEFAEVWEETRREYLKSHASDESEARYRIIGGPFDSGLINTLLEQPRDEDAPELHNAHQALTRLGGPSVSIVCLYGNAEHPTFDPDGHQPVSLVDVPDFSEARALLRRAVSISDGRLIRHLLQEVVLENWQKSSLLRRHKRILFDRSGLADIGGHSVRLDPELGIYVEDREGSL
jgi:CRISPR-associated endonuclease/helicase Cas3